jgi:hypothetical protein
LHDRKCEDCDKKGRGFGLPAERKKRWCGGCAKRHEGAVYYTSWPPAGSEAHQAAVAAAAVAMGEAPDTRKSARGGPVPTKTTAKAPPKAMAKALAKEDKAPAPAPAPAQAKAPAPAQAKAPAPAPAPSASASASAAVGAKKLRADHRGMADPAAAAAAAGGRADQSRTNSALLNDPSNIYIGVDGKAKRRKVCADCKLVTPKFGLPKTPREPGSGVRKWCGGCAEKHDGARVPIGRPTALPRGPAGRAHAARCPRPGRLRG